MVSWTRSSASAGVPLRRRGARESTARCPSPSRPTPAPLSFTAGGGRRAARRAVKRMFALSRLFGHAAARRAARAVLGAELGWEQRLPVARVSDPIAIQATPDGAACGFYGAGLVELLRLLVGYEGAMLHVACRARGGSGCEWRAAGPDPRHQ